MAALFFMRFLIAMIAANAIVAAGLQGYRLLGYEGAACFASSVVLALLICFLTFVVETKFVFVWRILSVSFLLLLFTCIAFPEKVNPNARRLIYQRFHQPKIQAVLDSDQRFSGLDVTFVDNDQHVARVSGKMNLIADLRLLQLRIRQHCSFTAKDVEWNVSVQPEIIGPIAGESRRVTANPVGNDPADDSID
jgi:hypothetical protein